MTTLEPRVSPSQISIMRWWVSTAPMAPYSPSMRRNPASPWLHATNGGGGHLHGNGQLKGNKGIRLRLIGAKSNRDGIGTTVRVSAGERNSSLTVKSGSSYLSQSELPVTFGLGARQQADKVMV